MLRNVSQSKLLKRNKRPYRVRRLFDRLSLCLAFAFVLFGLYCYKHARTGEKDPRRTTTTTTSKLKNGKCEELVRDWVSLQEQRYEKRVARAKESSDKPLTFFLHIPRTAGRTVNFCFLKHATPEKERCSRAYDELRTDLNNPKCTFLASHDDYSLVERMAMQPKVVTMVREVYSRTLSAYEFSVEVAMRSGGIPTKKPKNGKKTSTRDVWPWEYLVRYVDEDIQKYRSALDAKQIEKASIVDAYDNPVYTSLDSFLEIPMAQEDLHNAQFFQLLGLTNNTFVSYEPNAQVLRDCARDEGSKASEALFAYAKKRLRREIDALLVHEELDQSVALAAAMLNTPLDSVSYYEGKGNLDGIMENILRRTPVEDDHMFPHRASLSDSEASASNAVIFSFRLNTIQNLEDDEWREKYIEDEVKGAFSKFLGVEPQHIEVDPFAYFPKFQPKTWEETPGGRHLISIKSIPTKFRVEKIVARLLQVPHLLQSADATMSEIFSDLLQKYGPMMEISYVASMTNNGPMRRRDAFGPVGDKKTEKKTLGKTYRECEKFQGGRYKKQQTRAFDRLHELVENDKGYLFSKDARKFIKKKTVDRIYELNHLDVRLYNEAKSMMDANLLKYAKEMERQGPLPPSLLQSSFGNH
jgi:hypothetical protein